MTLSSHGLPAGLIISGGGLLFVDLKNPFQGHAAYLYGMPINVLLHWGIILLAIIFIFVGIGIIIDRVLSIGNVSDPNAVQ